MRKHILAFCVIAIGITVRAEDPPAPAVGSTFLFPLFEEKFEAEVAKAAEQVAKAEAVLAKARQTAGAARLKSYKLRLVELTKTGNTEEAAAVKARIDRLEEAPDADATIAPDQLPPGAAVYDIFPEEERPYLIKVYIAAVNWEPAAMDKARKKLLIAKGSAEKEAAQKDLDFWTNYYQLLRSTNDPPHIGSDINNWGQKVRSNTYSTTKDVEWKPGAVGTFADSVYPLAILDKDHAVVVRKFRKSTETQTLVAEGFDTSNMQVGRIDGLGGYGGVLWVTEMTTYTAAGGVQKPAALLEKFDWERYKAEREKLKQK